MQNLLSNRLMERAVNRGTAQIHIPWPVETLGVYGAHVLDGSVFSPEATDRAMDLYVAERFVVPEGVPVRISACAGRTSKLVPVIVVTVSLDVSKVMGVSR